LKPGWAEGARAATARGGGGTIGLHSERERERGRGRGEARLERTAVFIVLGEATLESDAVRSALGTIAGVAATKGWRLRLRSAADCGDRCFAEAALSFVNTRTTTILLGVETSEEVDEAIDALAADSFRLRLGSSSLQGPLPLPFFILFDETPILQQRMVMQRVLMSQKDASNVLLVPTGERERGRVAADIMAFVSLHADPASFVSRSKEERGESEGEGGSEAEREVESEGEREAHDEL
jgi:hypothetical protein